MSASTRVATPAHSRQLWARLRRYSATVRPTTAITSGRNKAATNFVMKPRTKVHPKSYGVSRTSHLHPGLARTLPRLSRPSEKMEDATAIGEQERRLHRVAAQPVVEEQRLVSEEDEDGRSSAHRMNEPRSNQEHVDERHAAEQSVPESEAELVVRKHAEADRSRHDPELEWWLFEEDSIFVGAALGREPVARFDHSIDSERINRFVAFDVPAAQPHEQRQAEQHQHESQPQPAVYSLTQVTSDQIRGMLTFSIETGSNPACMRKAGRSTSDLKPMCTVNGEIARSTLASRAFGLRK